jgi:hypothetical protein
MNWTLKQWILALAVATLAWGMLAGAAVWLLFRWDGTP